MAMRIITIGFILIVLNCNAFAKKIHPPIPKELKEACKDEGGGKRACLDEKLKEYCQDDANNDTITCKIVRLKTLIPKPVAGKKLIYMKFLSSFLSINFIDFLNFSQRELKFQERSQF